jgi:uncharacterized membrane protein YheB (UPF0754 family)
MKEQEIIEQIEAYEKSHAMDGYGATWDSGDHVLKFAKLIHDLAIQEAADKAKAVLHGTINPAFRATVDRDFLLKQNQQIVQNISSNIPFVREQFREQLDDMINAAKIEMEAYVEGLIRRKGLESLGISGGDFSNILKEGNTD